MNQFPIDTYNFFFIVLSGFMTVWTFRYFSRSQKKGDFEYLGLSAFWGLVLCAIVGLFFKYSNIPSDKINLFSSNPYAGGFTLSLIGIVGVYIANVVVKIVKQVKDLIKKKLDGRMRQKNYQNKFMAKKILKLIFSVGICEVVGIAGGLFTAPAISSGWYASLEKPFFSPPNWLFGPAWILLYALMGIALYLIGSHRSAMILFFVHLFFNGIWSIIFFGLKSPFYAFLDIIILWALILVLIFKFFKIRKIAGYLLLPYLFWVSFAGYLNYSIWTLNQETPVACTMDAKLCPDGSYVGRVAPNCEFALCPGEMEWQAIKQAIANCEVEKVWQAHDRRVEAKLKNGEELTTVEPELDDIIDLAIAAEPECGKILMGTE